MLYLRPDFECLPNYYGKFCATECKPNAQEYSCDEDGSKICHPGFIKFDDADVCLSDLCKRMPNYCQNNGKCTNPSPLPNRRYPECNCPFGFEGKRCESVSTIAPPPIQRPFNEVPANSIAQKQTTQSLNKQECELFCLNFHLCDRSTDPGMTNEKSEAPARNQLSTSDVRSLVPLTNTIRYSFSPPQNTACGYQAVTNSFIEQPKPDNFGNFDQVCTPLIQPNSTMNTLQRIKYTDSKYPTQFEIDPFYPTMDATDNYHSGWEYTTRYQPGTLQKCVSVEESPSFYYTRGDFYEGSMKNDQNSRSTLVTPHDHDAYKKLASISVLPSSISKRLSLINSDTNSDHSMKYGNLVTLLSGSGMETMQNGRVASPKKDAEASYSGRKCDMNSSMLSSRFEESELIGDTKIISHEPAPQFLAETSDVLGLGIRSEGELGTENT
ncbi:Dll1p [Cichlidogyrus casuarinus]|uniref:Dll1p n=1 Tax=Cichlidogyrus casuarinus TaxID=1844966 RepID=A0ABD2QG43_9PLAT